MSSKKIIKPDKELTSKEMLVLMQEVAEKIRLITNSQEYCRYQFGENETFEELVNAINDASWLKSNC